MGSIAMMEKPHAVCVPFPAQGHLNPMLDLAKLLHTHGFHITFVLTEFNHRRLIRSSGQKVVEGLPDFQFETIPDGLPFSDEDATQDIPTLCNSVSNNCLPHFRRLLAKLNDVDVDVDTRPPVSCIVSGGGMSFTLDAAHELGIPNALFWTTSACGYLAYNYLSHFIDLGFVPLKDVADLNNGFLDMEVDWIPGFMKGIRLKDFPSFFHTMDVEDTMLRFVVRETSRALQASAIILNTFKDLEQSAITALEKILPPIYSVGPLSLLIRNKISYKSPLTAINMSLWKKNDYSLQWLDERDPHSVVFVNFGSITIMTNEQLVEFAWGLANSGYDFLWVIRPDLVKGESSVMPLEFVEKTKERGLMVSWCAQEEVLMHPTVGVFLTHCGWNSTIETISGGVPMICWPFHAEQQTNCRYTCDEWGLGMEIEKNVNRDDVEKLIREIMTGEQKGKEIRKKAVEWKESATKAAGPNGVSMVDFERMITEILCSIRK